MSQRYILSTLDGSRLNDTLARCSRVSNAYVRAELTNKLRRAELCPPPQIPREIITMNSRALLLTDHWPTPRECYLVYPGNESCLEDRISIMSPLGVQLLGCREGTTLQVWNGKRALQVFFLGLTYQPEANKHWDL